MHGPSTQLTTESTFVSIDARVKILSLLLFVSVVAMSTQLDVLILALLFILSLLAFSRVSPRVVASRFLVALPFIGFASLSLYIVGSPTAALSMLIRISTCVLSVVLLSATTSLLDLIEGLKRLRFPRILLVLVLLTYRHIYIFKEEMRRIRTAGKARGGRSDRHLLDRRFMKTLSTMIGMIIMRAFWRGDRVYDSLLVRQFKGDLQVHSQRRLSPGDVSFAVCVSFVSLTLVLANFWVIQWM